MPAEHRVEIHEKLRALPTLGWAASPSPVVELDALARHLGLESLAVKRDDLLAGLCGGSKVRKLDALLAAPPFRDAPRWASAGAIGSSHLAACALAAAELGACLDAYVFLEPISAGVLENLAALSRATTRLSVHGSRAELVLRRPGLLGEVLAGVPVLPFGATSPPSIAAVARAGLELADQIESGELARPDAVYCALGTGGLAAGLALGLGLAGLSCEVRAVSVVEWPLASELRLGRLLEAAARWLSLQGITVHARQAAPVRVVRGQVGRGYGVVTARSLAGAEVLRREGVPSEPLYTGKAFAALLDDAARGRLPQRVLFWQSAHAATLPCDPDWRDRLPPRLEEWLARATSPKSTRRRALLGAGVAAVASAGAARVTGYAPLPGWTGTVLAPWEAHVVAAAADALSGVRGADGLRIAAAVDAFVAAFSPAKRAEIHELLALVEHGTTPLGLRLSRFTRLPLDAREAYLSSLRARGGLLAQAYRGLRDLVMLGAYQEPSSWVGLGYSGPWVRVAEPPLAGDDLTAAPGARPRAAERA